MGPGKIKAGAEPVYNFVSHEPFIPESLRFARPKYFLFSSTTLLMFKTSQRESEGHILALTGFRALAAFLVFFSHFPIPPKRFGQFFSDFCSELYISLSFFFILSGFLITLRYADTFAYNKKNFVRYMQNRFARVYPMYFILTTLTFYYHLIDPSFIPTTYYISSPETSSFTLYILNITFLRSFFQHIVISGIGQGWSLTVEECFYISAPLIFLLMKKIPLVIHVLALYLMGITLVYLCKDVNLLGLFASNKFMFISTFFGRCLEFYVGIQLAIWYKKDNSLLPGGRNTYLGLLSIILIVTLLTFTKDKSMEHPLGLYSTPGLFINILILPLGVGLFFYGLIREKTLVRSLLETRAAVLCGKCSYIFYLIHIGLLSELLYRYVTHNHILNFPFLILISIILYKLVEAPLNNLIRKI